MVLGGASAVFGIIGFIGIFKSLSSDMPIIAVVFYIYEILFGFLLCIAFCDFRFIKEHFMFLKTVTGKGLFNLFLASMFLVGGTTIYNYLMAALFGVCGAFFVTIGCCVKT